MYKRISEAVFVYIGLVIGAGFASGREILEYFSMRSRTDFTGIIIASFFFAFISYIILSLAEKYSVRDFDDFVDVVAGKISGAVKAFMLIYMFSGLFVMMSGSGALFVRAFSMESKYGIIVLAAVCFLVFSFDLKGLVLINNIMVPIMIAGIIYLCISTCLYGAQEAFFSLSSLRQSPLVAAVCYASYNTVTAGAVLVPLSGELDKGARIKAAAVSAAVLGILIFLVWSTVNLYYDKILESEMPLFDLSVMQGAVYEAVYSAVVFMALCTTAISNGFGVLSKLKLKRRSDRILAAALLCLIAMPFARFGFSDLVAKLYFIFGIIGVLWMGMLIYVYGFRK